MQAIILLAWILWLDGEDNESKRTLERARSIDSENVEVWLLDAALTHDQDKKVELYHKVLAKDPANIVAKGKLTEFQN
jgi:hypothetical protein